MRRTEGVSVGLRAAATVSAIAIAFVALGGTAATAAVDRARINTFPHWNGIGYVRAFGCPNATTFGQTITIPAGITHLNSLTFALANIPGSRGTMVVRAEVYAWDGTKATGWSLFEQKRTISFQDNLYHRETFRSAAGVSVTPGARYVLFVSIDKDYEKCSDYVLSWGFVGDDYHGGLWVWQANHGDETNWTTLPWGSIGGDRKDDLAFKVTLSA